MLLKNQIAICIFYYYWDERKPRFFEKLEKKAIGDGSIYSIKQKH